MSKEHLTHPNPSLPKRGAGFLPPFSWEEKVRIARPRLCEASGDATPQCGGWGMSLIFSMPGFKCRAVCAMINKI
jgi:hypothetical protein